jgi:hypothetical protein
MNDRDFVNRMHELMLVEQQCKTDAAENLARKARAEALQAELVVVQSKCLMERMGIKCHE